MGHLAKIILGHVALAPIAIGACTTVFALMSMQDTARAQPPVSVADSRIGPGMVLEISAVGVPDFRFRVAVDAAGEATFPLLETMRVDGMSLPELRARLMQELPHKVFHDRSADGRESYITLSPDEIILSVAEYQPIYVGGDVAKPGAVEFRPGITVWQAITLAGGLNSAPQGSNGFALISADTRGQIDAEMIEHEKQKAHAVALRALLANTPDVDIRHELKGNLAVGVLDRIAAVETDFLAASLKDQQNELQHLQESATQIQTQINYLEEERKSQEAGLAQQSRDLDRVRGLFNKGAATISQVNDEERQYGYASERMYQVAAQVMQATLAAGDVKRKLEVSVDQRRIRLLADLQDANTKADVATAHLSALNDKLAKAAAAPIQEASDSTTAVEITRHQRSDEGTAALPAGLHDILKPGDDLEVKLPRQAPVFE